MAVAPGPKRWRWRRRVRGRGRPPAPLYVYSIPPTMIYRPAPLAGEDCPADSIEITLPEFEAMRLVDYLEKSYEEAAALMGASRATVWRLARSARRKLVQSLLEGRPICVTIGGQLEEG